MPIVRISTHYNNKTQKQCAHFASSHTKSVGEVVPVDTSGPNDEDPEAVAEMEKLAAMKERERRTYFRQQRRELRARRIAERQARAAAEGVVLTDADAAKAIVLEAKEARARRVAAGEVVDEDDDDDDLDDFDIDDDDDDDEEDDEEDEDEEEQDEDENDIDDAADADHEDDENENPF
jgi:hypothetical protein